MEKNTTPTFLDDAKAIADLSETYPAAVSELERWQFLLGALGHDYNARIVCENHIEELLGDYEGAEHIDDVNGISEERHHTLGDLNILAGAAAHELELREHRRVSVQLVEMDLRRDMTKLDHTHARTWNLLQEAAAKIKTLEGFIGDTVSLIEAYADDHNGDRPTDVTVVLPQLRHALIYARSEGWLEGWLASEDDDEQQDLFSE